MKATTAMFEYGQADGFPCLHIDCEGEPFRPDFATALIRQESRPAHMFAWLDNVQSWDQQELCDWLMTAAPELPLGVVGIRKLGDSQWPPVGASWVLDVTDALAKTSLRELAGYLAKYSNSHPRVADVVAHAPESAFTSASLDMIADAVNPDGRCYLYSKEPPPSLDHIVMAASRPWSVRPWS